MIIIKHLIGKKFGRLLVLEKSYKKVYLSRGWVCLCDCGEIVTVDTNGLTSGRKKSCGCYQKESAGNRRREITKTRNIEEALYSRFKKNDDNDCWNWIGRKDRDGYGGVILNGKNIRGHRLSYAYFNNVTVKSLEGFLVCHKCDNPSCVNPDHLFLGTVKDNLMDARDKGRAFVGEKNNKAKLKSLDIPIIRNDSRKHAIIAKDYNVTRATISNIKRRSTWKHIK